MIQAIIFDFDDVIVKTEHLKAVSYARAISQLCPGKFDQETVEALYDDFISKAKAKEDDPCICNVSEPEVMETYKEMVGRSRRDMAEAMVSRFGLQPFLVSTMEQFGLDEPWQALIKVRMPIYESILDDLDLLRNSQWLHNTGEDVNQGKPDPEIYRLVSQQLNIPPSQCLVIEDSPSGIRAGLSAGMSVIAVTTPFSKDKVHAADILDKQWIVDDPALLPDVFDRMIQNQKTDMEL